MVFEKIAQPYSADDVARVVYSRRPAAEAARVNNSRHTCCRIYFSKTINPRNGRPIFPRRRGLMAFEKITQPSFPGRGSDRVSFARLFKAGRAVALLFQSRSDG